MSSFYLQIVTPDGSRFDGQAEKLTVRTIDGDVTILPRHTDYLTARGRQGALRRLHRRDAGGERRKRQAGRHDLRVDG